MRTTVTIDDELLRAAKDRAARRGITVGGVINQALHRELLQATPVEPPPIPVFHGGNGPAPGVDLMSNRGLYDLLDEDAEQHRR